MLALAVAVSVFTYETTLPNGAKIVSQPVAGAKRFAICAGFRGGSAYETSAARGSYHLLEHALFLNPLADETAESAGCQIYAATYRELIIFTCEGPAESIASGIQAMKQLLRPIAVSADSLSLEREVIRNEIALAKCDTRRSLLDELWGAACKESPFAFDTLGDLNAMTKVDSRQLNDLFEQTFCGANCFLTVSGPDVSAAEAGQAVAQLKTGAPKTPPQFPAIQPSRSETSRFRGVVVGFGMQADKQALWSVLANLLRIAAQSRKMETECTIGRASCGGIVSFWFSSANEDEVKDFLKTFSTTKTTESQLSAAKTMAKSETDIKTLSPLEIARSTCIFGALGLQKLSSQELDSITRSQADAAVCAFDPNAAVWLIGKRP